MTLTRHLAVPALALALAAAGCGSDNGGGSGTNSTDTAGAHRAGERYPAAVRQNFITSCDAQKGATRTVCTCALRQIERTVAFDDFRSADAALQAGKKADPAVNRKMTAAVKSCA